MYCDRCGTQLTPGGQYCTKCGKAILGAGAAVGSAGGGGMGQAAGPGGAAYGVGAGGAGRGRGKLRTLGALWEIYGVLRLGGGGAVSLFLGIFLSCLLGR